MRTNYCITFAILLGLCTTSLSAQDGYRILKKHVMSTLKDTSLHSFKVVKEDVSAISGVHHIYYQQLLHGIPVDGTSSSLHLSSNGEVVSEVHQFIEVDASVQLKHSEALLQVEDGLLTAFKELDLGDVAIDIISKEDTFDKASILKAPAISERNIIASLGYTNDVSSKIRLFWNYNFFDEKNLKLWDIKVDALSGSLFYKQDIMERCDFESRVSTPVLNYNANLYDIPNYKKSAAAAAICENCYEVIPFPNSSPYHTERTVVLTPANLTASPYGWHDTNGVAGAETTKTEGNNVIAIEAHDQYGFQPDGGSFLDFTGYEFEPIFSTENQYVNASITNLFYWTNIMHDVLYTYGFDEASGNFQKNNYGRGGIEGDELEAYGQSEGGDCTAFFGALRDGESPFMRMNLCGDKDSNFDSTVIIHEYTHGMVSRMRAGGIGGSCNGGNDENPKEGWCDWFAAVLTIQPTHTGADPRPIGAFFKNQGPSGSGVRDYPYSTDIGVNAQDYGTLRDGMNTHDTGAVWAEILWEVTWTLIDYYGFDPNVQNFTGDINQDAGNIMALAIVSEGLKLTPCNIGFVYARDSIILAASLIYGPDIACSLWEGFAKRGLGFGAFQGDSNYLGDQIVSYDDNLTSSFDLELDQICLANPIYEDLNGGKPAGGVYSGPGVTDSGNGRTFSFDPSVAGVGEHEISYVVPSSVCFAGANEFISIHIINDDIAPTIICSEDMVIVNIDDERFEIPDFSDLIYVEDNCSNRVQFTQTPAAGLVLKEGEVEVIIEATDVSNNSSTCSFKIKISHVIQDPVLLDVSLKVFPNPFAQIIQMHNPLKIGIRSYQIRDLHGRLIRDEPIEDTSSNIPVDLENLASGVYFMEIYYKNIVKMFRIVKE